MRSVTVGHTLMALVVPVLLEDICVECISSTLFGLQQQGMGVTRVSPTILHKSCLQSLLAPRAPFSTTLPKCICKDE